MTRARWRRRSPIVALAISVPLLAYLLAANIALQTDLVGGLINRRPERLEVTWKRAWTPLPGVVIARDIDLRGRTAAVEWRARSERLSMLVNVLALPWRQFDASLVRATNLDFELRPGTASGGADRETGGPADLPSKDRRAWTVALANVHLAAVRNVQIASYRLSGDGTVSGALELRIGRDLEAERLTISFPLAHLEHAAGILAREITLESTVSSGPIDLPLGDPIAALAVLSGRLSMTANVTSVDFLDQILLERAPWLEIDGNGRLRTDLTIERGNLVAGSTLDLDTEHLEIALGSWEAQGRGTIKGRVSSVGTQIRTSLSAFEVHDRRAARLVARGEDLELRIVSESLSLNHLPPDVRLTLDLPDSEIPDLSFLGVYLPSGAVRITGGRGRLAGRFTADSALGEGEGTLRISGHAIEAGYRDLPIRGDFELDLRARLPVLTGSLIVIDGSTLELRNQIAAGDGRSSDRRGEGWWADLDVTRGWVMATEDWRLETHLDGRLRDTGPLVALAARDQPRLAWFDDLLTVRDVRGRALLRADPRSLELHGLRAEARHVELLAEIDVEEQGNRGALYARYGPFSAAVGLEAGDRDWKIFRSRRWYHRRAAELRAPGDRGAVQAGEPMAR